MDRIYIQELVRSFQCGTIGRRQFLSRVTKIVGSAAAAQMLLTACQHSNEDNPDEVVQGTRNEEVPSEPVVAAGIVSAMVNYPGGEDGLMGYLARPDDDAAHPAVVVIQEWWGLNEHIKDVTRRFAEEGFVALAPDLYHGQVVSEPDAARSLAIALDRDAAVQEIQSATDYLQQQSFVSVRKVGTVGFCMGGWLSLQTAVDEADVGASVAFYGRPLTADEVGSIQAPIMGNYGADDRGIPVANVEAMQTALSEAGIENDIKIYDGADHAFFNDTRPSYHEEASKDAWERTLGWYRKHLV